MLPLRSGSALASTTHCVFHCVWASVVCVSNRRQSNTQTQLQMWTYTSSHAQQVIQISIANSEPESRNKTVQIFCQRQKQRHITITSYQCVCVCICVCVCSQIEFDLLKFDIFRDTSTANQANMSWAKTSKRQDGHWNNQLRKHDNGVRGGQRAWARR